MLSAKEKCLMRLASLEKALSAFEEARQAYSKDPKKHIHIMALIKSFEISFELGWKALKSFLEHKEIVKLRFAREAIKHAFHKSVIKDGRLWIYMLEDRNKLSHIYDAALADQMAKKISKNYIKEITSLFHVLKKEL